MADPKVILEDTLALARAGLAPPAAVRRRLRIALAIEPMASPVSGRAPEAGSRASGGRSAASEALPASGWTAIKGSGMAGIISGALLISAGFVGGYWMGLRESAPAPAAPTRPVEAIAAPPPATARPSVVGDEASRAAPPRAPLAQPHAVPQNPGSAQSATNARALRVTKATRQGDAEGPEVSDDESADAFTREMALLQRVERALRNEDPALVLTLLDELDARHPRGVGSEERQASRVMAHCQAKEIGAHLAAERFLRALPHTVYTDRVRSVCDLQDRRTPEP